MVALAADGGGRCGAGGAPQAVGPFAGHIASSQRSPGSHLESVGSRAAAHLLNGVAGGLEEDDVDFVEEDAGQEPKAGSQNCDHLHGRDELAIRAGVSRDEGDPDDEEYQHAECDELGLVKILRQLPRFEGEEEANGGQEAGVADEEAEGHQGALVAGDEDDLVLQLVVAVAGWRRCVQPNHADDDLHKRAQEDQEELEVEAPPLSVEAGGDLCLKDKQDTVGFHQDARDAEDKTDAESWLPQPASPVLGLADEEQRAGEAAEQGEEEEVRQLPVRGLHNRCVAEFGEDSQDKRSQENSQHGKESQSNPKGLGPGQKLYLLGDAGCVVLIGPVILRALVTGTRI